VLANDFTSEERADLTAALALLVRLAESEIAGRPPFRRSGPGATAG
jgi:hypothetical protein